MANYVTRDFSAEELKEEYGVTWNGTAVVFTEIVDTLRWSTLHRSVFQVDDQLYEVDWESPATESQECETFGGNDPVTCREVLPVAAQIYTYRPLEVGEERPRKDLSEVFPPGRKPRKMTREQLLQVLDRVRSLVERDDSMEASFMYAWSDEPDLYDVGGAVRVGNSEGQGSVMLLWDNG